MANHQGIAWSLASTTTFEQTPDTSRRLNDARGDSVKPKGVRGVGDQRQTAQVGKDPVGGSLLVETHADAPK